MVPLVLPGYGCVTAPGPVLLSPGDVVDPGYVRFPLDSSAGAVVYPGYGMVPEVPPPGRLPDEGLVPPG